MSSNSFESLPEVVKETARSLLAESVLVARTKEPPGDGSMIILGDRRIGEGKWSGGYDLQASFVEDERRRKGPFVVVHIYRGSQCAIASVEEGVEYSFEERLALDATRLADLKNRRVALDGAIAKLEASVAERVRTGPAHRLAGEEQRR
jgi:hypothetical protein